MTTTRAVIVTLSILGSGCAVSDRTPFHLQEATVGSVQGALARKEITCTQLTRLYLDRIEAYNLKGPTLRAIITVNPKALEVAAEMDRRYADNPSAMGPLHCVPIILKDNFNTFDMPTSSGHVAMKDSIPPADAFTVDRMRKAGALILAKANLQEFARGGMSRSSLGGQVLNPYDLTRTPGGSSGGTGVAIAANLGLLGTGSDTGQSIRSPASANNLVGIRPTRGLVSRAGVAPNSLTQDEIGPITRTVRDAALLLDVMARLRPGRPDHRVQHRAHSEELYASSQSRRAERRAHRRHEQHVRRGGAASGGEQGDGRRDRQSGFARRDRRPLRPAGIRQARLGDRDLAVRSAHGDGELLRGARAECADQNVRGSRRDEEVSRAEDAGNGACGRRWHEQSGLQGPHAQSRRLRLVVATKMADLGLDAILYPLPECSSRRHGQRSARAQRHAFKRHGSPAVTFPGRFSTPTPSAPLGVPVGADFLGWRYSEAKLLAYAYAFEQVFRPRNPPASTPPLLKEP